MSDQYEGLAPEFRPGGTKDPKWMDGVRRLLADGVTSVEPQIVADLFAYYDAAKGHGTKPSFLERLEAMWAETASIISYHHADDSTREWGHATALRPLLLELERQIKRSHGGRPDGKNYLLGSDFRIEWPTPTAPA
ncbi:hypothetical protein OSJ57_23330 [Sphingomonas sp. HH69]